MKVLLVNPPAFNEIIGNNPPIIESERGYNPPLGLLYIASYLLEHTRHDVTVIDSQVEELTYLQLQARIEEIQPEVVGITTMSLTLLDVIKTIEVVKKVNANTIVVLGGPHVTIYPEETIHLPGVDFIVLGEGEETFTDLLDALEEERNLKGARGIVFKKGGEIYNTGRKPPIQNLNSLPHPARHLTPYRKYYSLLTKRIPITTMVTSRGCPFVCTFCDRPHLGKVFRARSPKNVVEEMEACVEMGIHEFLIYDDNFTLDKKRVIDICNGITKKKLDVSWYARAHINTVSEEMLDKMKAAGCQGIHYGIESGVERILKIIKKGITKEKAKEVFKMTRKRNILLLAYFMIGLPTETREDIKETFNFAKELDPDYIHLTILTPFPATQIYLEGLEPGIIKKDYWREFAINPIEDFVPPYWEEIFIKEELEDLLANGYKSFYLRPNYILRSLLKLNSFGELKRKAKAGLKVLKM